MEHRPGENLAPAADSGAWTAWSPSEQVRPVFARSRREGYDCLVIGSTGKKEVYGCWRCEIDRVEPQRHYMISAQYDSDAENDAVCVSMIATWTTREGKLLQRDYVDEATVDAEAIRLSRVLQAPGEAGRLRLELVYRWSSSGEVRWRNPQVCRAEAPGQRLVRAVSVYFNPFSPNRGSLADNERRMLEIADEAGQYRPDIICFAETMLNRASGVPLAEAAQPIPGPLTRAFGEKARRLRSYIVLNLHEVDGGLFYNTTVLLDRNGDIVGKYRKVHITLFEWESGIMPGDDYPVFDTDFGRIGVLVCWDHWFPESARALRLQGAEMVFVPTAGDARIQSIARAVENGMYVVVSGVNGEKPCRIVAPDGEILCETERRELAFCTAEIDLNRVFRTRWLSVGPGDGEGRSIYAEERRPDTYDFLARRRREDTAR